MDTLTHALSGALIGRAAGHRQPRAGEPPPHVRGWVGFAAAVFPDIDGLLRLVDELLYLQHHRAETHSLVLLPIWAVLLGGAAYLICRRSYRLHWLILIAALGLAIHIAGDLITAYGTRIFAPLTHYSLAPGWVLVIDPWLTALLLIALAASWRAPSPGVACAGLGLVCAFVLLQGALNGHAAGIARAHASAIGWHDARVRALAQPYSPFNRMLIVERDGEYERARVSLLRRETPRVDPAHWRLWQLHRSYRPVHDPGWQRFALLPTSPDARALARDAWQSPALAAFRDFAHHPVFYGLERGDGGTCVWFTDLRYWYHPLPAPFRFGGCRANDTASWVLHELRSGGSRTVPRA